MLDPEVELRQQLPALRKLTSTMTERWPDHLGFIEKSMSDRPRQVMEASEQLSEYILALSENAEGGLNKLCDDYRYLCQEIILPEEVYFRRNGKYRLNKFIDAKSECYDNNEFMSRYMNGLLASNVFWSNHAHAFSYFINEYLPLLPTDSHHLEIGPGHGLFLHCAAQHNAVTAISGWDVSATSIEQTGHALAKLNARLSPTLVLQDIFDAPAQMEGSGINSVALSEILEHLEEPSKALSAIYDLLPPEGLTFINVPANSPAPDHIFLYHSLDHAVEMVTNAGFEIVDAVGYPMGGVTIERAMKHRLVISCVIVGRKA